jgi:hypothetical protein
MITTKVCSTSAAAATAERKNKMKAVVETTAAGRLRRVFIVCNLISLWFVALLCSAMHLHVAVYIDRVGFPGRKKVTVTNSIKID